MKQPVLFSFLLLMGSSAFSQTYKGQWLAGGSGSFSSTTTPKGYGTRFRFTSVSIEPDAGYFVMNQLAAGIRPGFYLQGTKSTESDSLYNKYRTQQTSLSPFVRYYVLKPGSRINLLVDAAYNWYWVREKSDDNVSHRNNKGYAFSAGPVWFITPSSALELTAKYTRSNDWYAYNAIAVSVGFHQHFGKAALKKKS